LSADTKVDSAKCLRVLLATMAANFLIGSLLNVPACTERKEPVSTLHIHRLEKWINSYPRRIFAYKMQACSETIEAQRAGLHFLQLTNLPEEKVLTKILFY